jgi:peptidyl-prolyl cis-trans isomerase SurA
MSNNQFLKNLFLSAFFACFIIVSNAQVLFRYGSKTVQKDEFWRAYSKNNTGVTTSTTIRDYLDLYIKFKLKVQAAKDQKLDTLASVKNDLAGFRAQMAEQFIQKLPYRKEMIQQAVDRSKLRIELSHIFIDFGNDSAAAKIGIDKAYTQLQSGADFAITSRTASNDPYVRSKDGYIGYISVFSLPYDLENVVYGMKKGAYSKPIAGKKGWHIFKVSDIQSNTTVLKAAQIFFAADPEARPEAKSLLQQKVDSIHKALLGGSDFTAIAQQYSNDKFTYQTGGVLPAFTFTEYDPVFSKAVFDLKNNGEISSPIETESGWHIVKLLGRDEENTDINNPENFEIWSQKVSQDDRIKIVTQSEKEAIRKAAGYKALPYNKEALWVLTDSMLKTEDYVTLYKSNNQKKLFQLTNQSVTYTDWLKFIKDKTMASNERTLDGYNELMAEFTESKVTQYYKDHLEQISPDFRYQMQEFLEGSLLFEVMERNVWSVAPTDTAGLKRFYAPRTQQYIWKQSANAIIFNCADSTTANKIHDQMEKNPLLWKTYMEESNGYAVADSNRFENNQLPLKEVSAIKEGWLSPTIVNETDGSTSFCYIRKLYPDNELRSFDEAKGLVINDYQIFLEEKWVEEQKKKYPIKIDEAVVKSLKN